jgi:hypothetical protein
VGAAALFGPFIISAGGVSAALHTVAGSAWAAAAPLAAIAAPLAVAAGVFLVAKRAQDGFRSSLEQTASKMTNTGASLNAYANAVRKAADEQGGLSGAITRSNLLTRENEVVAATDSYLRYGLQVHEAVLSDKEFDSQLKKLQFSYRANRIDAVAYEQGVQGTHGG